ncbi:MAG: AAA family ATPase, partial [Pseudomonadales bacterium]|nr:AAA family ATPase [Pseudomonadales bacterium]
MALQIADYHILKTLYSNANTIVVRAEDRKTHETVILKHLTVDAVNNNQLARFAFSYDVLSKFNHANVIKPIRWIDDGHGPTMAMEDINGVDLHQYAASFENKQLPVIPFLTLAIQLADGLGEIHHAQVIHKDLHPGNIIVTPDQENAKDFQLQIIDFGLASLLTREQPSLAAPDKLEGILAYISPEQTGRMNRALDYRTDFYSLGVILYQLLTGTLPYTADNAMSWVYAHIARPITPVTKIRNDVPPLVSAIIDKLLAKNAEDRYQSAWGLRHDLENCLRSLESGSRTPSFPLGQTDISDHLHIPQILYGRQDEIRQLLSTFTEATEGTPQLLVVTGNAGIGKSALIHEIHKPIAEHDGLFISGKFDQFQKNIPYSALKQALQQWLQQQLTKSDKALEHLKRKLTLHLGKTARLMIEFMGELRHVLEDNLPKIPELVPVQSEVRLKTTVSRLVQFIAMHQPLVLFIDDLQWADRGTLSLLPELLQPNRTQHHDTIKLMVIVAYRDNEVDQSHPTTLTLTQIEHNKNPCTRLCLAPLPPGHIVKMLEDTLHLSSVTVSPLADLVYRKTAGNPFFINEFLRSLYHDGELRFNLRKQRWDWDLEAIRNTVVTDNVVDLMLHKMTHLPKVTRELIQMASCLGSRFDLDILARLAQRSIADITRELWPALKAGLLLQEGGEWSLGSISEQLQGDLNYDENRLYQTQISPLLPHCRFLHDRMLQAAYESIAKPKQLQLHLAIGRVLLDMAKKSGPQKSTGLTDIPASQLYEVVEHLNQAQSLLSSEPDFLELAELNMQASLLAKEASVWSAALTYAQAGNQQLRRTTNQPETLQFQLQLMELDMLFMNGKREKALSLATDLEHMTSNRINKARVCCSVVTNALTSTFEMIDKLLEKGIDGLRHCDQTVPGVDEINDQYIERLYQDVRPVVNKKIQHLVVCREEENPRLNLIFRLFAQLGLAAQVSGRQPLLRYCCLKGAQIAFQEQVPVRGIVLLAYYSVILSRHGDHQEARNVAEKVMDLCRDTPDCPDIPMIYNCLGAQNWHCYHPLQEAISVLMNAHQTGYEYGDLIRGVFAGYSNSLISRFSQGTPFSVLEPHFKTLFLLKDKMQMSVSAGSYYARLIAILSAQGNANLLTESAFDAKEWQLIQNSTLLGFIHHLQL